MSKPKVIESIFSKPILRESVSEKGEKKYTISGPFTMADKVNGNGRIYPKEVLNKAIAKFREMVKQKRVKMSLDHADWSVGTLKDTAAILTDISDVQPDGFAYYEAQIIDTTRGKDLKIILDSGAMVGVSTVAIGSFLEDQEYPGVEGKHPVMQDGMCLKKVDFVDDPSVSETEARMQLESTNNGTCYVYNSSTEQNPKKENKMKTFEELKQEFPIIAEFETRVNSEKKELETKLTESSVKIEESTKTIGELTAKITTLESKVREMVDSLKNFIPEAFTVTNVPETDLLKQKDEEIVSVKNENASLAEKLQKATESFSTLEKKIVESEKAQAIAKLQASDPDYFKSKTAVKAFEACLNAEEIQKCYENYKAIMLEQVEANKSPNTPEPGKTTTIPEAKPAELTKAEESDFNFVNLTRKSSGMSVLTVEQYRASKK